MSNVKNEKLVDFFKLENFFLAEIFKFDIEEDKSISFSPSLVYSDEKSFEEQRIAKCGEYYQRFKVIVENNINALKFEKVSIDVKFFPILEIPIGKNLKDGITFKVYYLKNSGIVLARKKTKLFFDFKKERIIVFKKKGDILELKKEALEKSKQVYLNNIF